MQPIDTAATIGELLSWILLPIGLPVLLTGWLISYVQRRRAEGTDRDPHSPVGRMLTVVGGVLTLTGVVALAVSLLPTFGL